MWKNPVEKGGLHRWNGLIRDFKFQLEYNKVEEGIQGPTFPPTKGGTDYGVPC